MRILFRIGDIVEEQVEGLVCSGNVQLNMSGGVNGELLLRGGQAMQEQLHAYLRQTGRRYVEPGFAMAIGPEPTRFRRIVYTVAIDAFYDSSVELVCTALTNSLRLLQEVGCRSIAIPALATGYGHLPKPDFGQALRQCLAQGWPFDEIRVVLRDQDDLREVAKGYGKAGGP